MSSETRHTPGPILNDGETPKGVMLLAGPEDRETVIYLQGPERQQYARLFEAAPELLGLLEEWTADQTECGCDTAACQGNCLPARSRAAIAKATGQEG